MSEHTAEKDAPRIGDKIRFHPHGGGRWWTIRARDERFIVATTQAPFKPKGELWYTVVDLTGWQSKRYNGAGNSIVRSSLNTLGGGWDVGPNGEGCEAILDGLRSGEWELSHRRVVNVWSMETRVSRPADRGPCPTCEAITPTGLRRRELAGFCCPTCERVTPDPTRDIPPGGSDA
jgi:hypothetical protein